MNPRPPDSPPAASRAVITLALGPAMYRNMAVNLLRSIRYWHPSGDLPLTLVTDDPTPLPSDLRSVQLVVLERDALGVGFETKLHLDRLAPAPCTLFIDADCLLYEPLDRVFELLAGRAAATVGGAMSEGEWFGDVAALCRQLGVPAIPRFNGGLYYLERGAACTAVYQRARELAGRYDELGLVRLRGRPNDELIMASAMALAGLAAFPDDGTFMSDPQACRGPYRVNVLRGERELFNPPAPSPLHQPWYPFIRVQPTLVHYLGHFTTTTHYRLEARRLRLEAHGLPAAVANAAALLLSAPALATDWFKDRLRPLFHRLLGPRRVHSAGR